MAAPVIAKRQSAAVIVDEKSVGKIPMYTGTVEGPNGSRSRQARKMHEYERREKIWTQGSCH